MHVLRVIWLKQLGELLAGVVHEVVECLQARQYDQVFGEELLPQVVPGDGRVNDYAPHAKYPPADGPGVNAAGTITDFAHLNASA